MLEDNYIQNLEQNTAILYLYGRTYFWLAANGRVGVTLTTTKNIDIRRVGDEEDDAVYALYRALYVSMLTTMQDIENNDSY